MNLWIAIIGGLCTAVPTVIATISANKKNTALITYRLEQLEIRIKEHNNFGIRIQYSFFECEMEQSQLEKLKNEILKIIQKKEDSLRIYPLC